MEIKCSQLKYAYSTALLTETKGVNLNSVNKYLLYVFGIYRMYDIDNFRCLGISLGR